MVEMHLHLAKGHAWDWEEKRRLDELEDEADDIVGPYLHVTSNETSGSIRLPHRPMDGLEIPDSIAIPAWAIDPSVQPISPWQTYSDGHTPVQRYLTGGHVVPESLRALIKEMLSPQAAARPTAVQALNRLKRMRPSQ